MSTMITEKSPIALITGCSQPDGIGACVAIELLKEGYRVFATCREPVSRLNFLSKLGFYILELDVTDEQSILKAVDNLSEQTDGKLDVLVNNAGMVANAPILETPLPSLRRFYETNLFSVIAVSQASLPLLVKTSKIPGRRVVIWNVASLFGKIPTPWVGAYTSSKAALISISESMRYELMRYNIAVFTGVLSHVRTSFQKDTIDLRHPSAERGVSFWPDFDQLVVQLSASRTKAFESAPKPQGVAHRMVKKIMGSSKGGQIYDGRMWWLNRYILLPLPGWIKDRLILANVPTEMVVSKHKA